MVIVSHVDVCKNELEWHLSEKTCAYGWRFIKGGGGSFIIPRTRECTAHVISRRYKLDCCKQNIICLE